MSHENHPQSPFRAGALPIIQAFLILAGFVSGALAQTPAFPASGELSEPPGEAAVSSHPTAPLLSATISTPPIPTGEWTRQQIPIARTSTPPVMDGTLDDACWQNATRAVGFFRFGSSAPILDQTEAWLTADENYIYIAFHCLDREPERIRSSETQRGGEIFGDDHVAVEIDSQNTRRATSWFGVSANGTQSESLEGGTAENITWAGDWKAAARRTPDGWVAEMAIPFRLLRYPKGARSFGILLYRRLARETNRQVWPYIPPAGQTDSSNNQFMHDFTGIAPPFYAPRPTFLPYVLASAGEGSSAREGLDVKYPISTTLTGVATLYPDFKTVEQAVTDISFSYNERFVPDRRPFFAESNAFFPDTSLFYSRRIEAVDQGFKVAGKSGFTTLGGLFASNRQPGQERSSFALNARRDIGLFSNAGFSLVGDNRRGRADNRVGRLYGTYGMQQGQQRYEFDAAYTRSLVNDSSRGAMLRFDLDALALPGRPGYSVEYTSIGADFTSDLGLVPERDRRGWVADIFQFNRFDRGPVEFYDIGCAGGAFRRRDGSFFRNFAAVFGYIQDRRGRAIELGLDKSSRQQSGADPRYHDLIRNFGFSWNQRTLFQGGELDFAWGRQAGENLNFVSVSQGFLIARPISLNTSFSQQKLGEERTTQLIVTGTYRLNAYQAISGRLIRQDGSTGNAGQSIGVVRGTNLYLAFSQRSRRGADLFVLLGDPNSDNTRGQVSVKLLRPY